MASHPPNPLPFQPPSDPFAAAPVSPSPVIPSHPPSDPFAAAPASPSPVIPSHPSSDRFAAAPVSPSPVIPSQPPSNPFAAAPASPSPSPPPPSNTYSDPFAAAASPFFDLYSLVPIQENYQNPDNCQFYAGGNNSLSLENNNNPFSPSDFLSPQNYLLYSANESFVQSLLSGNHEPYAADSPLPLQNHHPYAGDNILSHENSANTFLSSENHQSYAANTSLSHEKNEETDAGNSSLSLPQQQQPTFSDWTAILPVGMKFRPTDDELIIHYLMPYIINGSSPPDCPVTPLDVYKYEPRQLLGLGHDHGDGKRYFITPIKKIGRSTTDRCVDSKAGWFWKPTQAAKPIYGAEDGSKVGEKIPLSFYHKKRKSPWRMQEVKLPKKGEEEAPSKHYLEFVVALVYYHRRSGKTQDYNVREQE